jgi:hypothetical protein
MDRAVKWLLGGPLPVEALVYLVEAMAFQFNGVLVHEWNTSQVHIGIEISDHTRRTVGIFLKRFWTFAKVA